MRPLAVLIALVFGSSTAISFGLTATAIIFLILRPEHPELARELPALIRSCLGFLALSAIAGACLYATLNELRWRRGAQAVMWLALAAIAWWFWPS